MGRNRLEQISRKKQKDLEEKSVLKSYCRYFPRGLTWICTWSTRTEQKKKSICRGPCQWHDDAGKLFWKCATPGTLLSPQISTVLDDRFCNLPLQELGRVFDTFLGCGGVHPRRTTAMANLAPGSYAELVGFGNCQYVEAKRRLYKYVSFCLGRVKNNELTTNT